LADRPSWPVFLGLRDGTVHTVTGLNAEGIITFPSLHAALGVLFPLALWRTAVVRWLALLLNGLILIANPAYGSHYVVDVIAGVIIALACWGCCHASGFVQCGCEAKASRRDRGLAIDRAGDIAGTGHDQAVAQTRTGLIHYSQPCDRSVMACHAARVQCSRGFDLFQARALAMC
jgi:PAP2 superfamily